MRPWCHHHRHYSPRAGLNSSNFLTVQGMYRRYDIIKFSIYSTYYSSGWSTSGIRRKMWHNLFISAMVSFSVFFEGSVSNITVVPPMSGPSICSVDASTSSQALATAQIAFLRLSSCTVQFLCWKLWNLRNLLTTASMQFYSFFLNVCNNGKLTKTKSGGFGRGALPLLINCRPKERLDVAHGRKPKEETLSPFPRQQLSQGEATILRTLSLLQGTFPS